MDAVHRHLTRKIDALRTAKGLSINRLADFAGVSRGYLSRVLKGQQSPSVKTLAKLAEALGVSVGELFER